MDNEAQQRYNRLQKTILDCLLFRKWGRSGGLVSYIYWRTQVRWQVSPVLGQTLVCAAFQFSTQRQFSLRLPVYVRGVGSADRTSAIGLEVGKRRVKDVKHNVSTYSSKAVENTVKTGINPPLTIYPHTSHGIRGYKVIPEVAAYTQSH